MSFITVARLITQKYQSRMLSAHLYSRNQNICRTENDIKVTIISVMQKRFFGEKKVTNKELKKDYKQIYFGHLSKKIKFVKLFSLSSSAITLSFQPQLIPKILEVGGLNLASGIAIGFTCFMISTPLILHMFTGKYINEIYYNKCTDTYIATTFSLIATRKELMFTNRDVETAYTGQMLTNCRIKNRPLLMEVTCFTDPEYYRVLMNYDKPMDFGFEKNIKSYIKNEEKISKHDEQQTVKIKEKVSIKN